MNDNQKAPYENEFGRNWFLLLTALLGGTTPSILAFTTGVFTTSWEEEFGWTRGEVGAALGVLHVAVILVAPLMGRVIDRHGVRRPTLWSLGLLVFVISGLSQVGPQLWTLYVAYFLFGAVSSGAGFISYTRVVGEYFDRHRGLALGITCSATSLTALLMPILANYLIGLCGWQAAWLGLALLIVVIWPIIYFGLKEVHQTVRSPTSAGPQLAAVPTGYREVLEDRRFWLLAGSFLLMTFMASGMQVQTVPFLLSVGLPRDAAIVTAASLGIGLGVSRLATGCILDRVFAPTVFKALCFVGIAGCTALLAGREQLAVPGVITIGAVMGAEGDIMAYAVSRYFGLRNYAKAYGLLYSINALGPMCAPAINGHIYDLTGSYTRTIFLAILVLLASAFLMHRMPAYPSDGGGKAVSGPSGHGMKVVCGSVCKKASRAAVL
jgi:MFS family permease